MLHACNQSSMGEWWRCKSLELTPPVRVGGLVDEAWLFLQPATLHNTLLDWRQSMASIDQRH
jgi:hypothetical protein